MRAEAPRQRAREELAAPNAPETARKKTQTPRDPLETARDEDPLTTRWRANMAARIVLAEGQDLPNHNMQLRNQPVYNVVRSRLHRPQEEDRYSSD